MKYYISWSVILKGKNLQKIRSNHIPVLEKLIGPTISRWSVERTDDPEVVRATNFANFTAECRERAFLEMCQRVYRLCPGAWRINGPQLLNQEDGFYLLMQMAADNPGQKSIPIIDVLVEVQPGELLKREGGGFWIDGQGEEGEFIP